jgi:hypothetical protein
MSINLMKLQRSEMMFEGSQPRSTQKVPLVIPKSRLVDMLARRVPSRNFNGRYGEFLQYSLVSAKSPLAACTRRPVRLCEDWQVHSWVAAGHEFRQQSARWIMA